MHWHEKLDIPTACTDGESIYYNPKFVDSLSPQQLIGLVVHEICHPLFGHLERFEIQMKTHRELVNIAADYEINNLITEYNKSAAFPIILPDEGLVDLAKYGSEAAEVIYKKLLKDPPPKGKMRKASSCGEFTNAKDPKKAKEQQEKWREILAASIQTAKLRGEGSSSFIAKIAGQLESPVDLATLLERYLSEFTMSDDSTKPDKHYLADYDICVAGMESEQFGKLVFVKDTSGSIDGDILASCVSVIQSAADRLKTTGIIVLDVDTEVCNVEEFHNYDQIPLTAYGRGGTDFRPAFVWLEEECPDARVLVYLTDGYGPFPEVEPDVPVIWLTYGIKPEDYPFGNAICLKDAILNTK